MEIHYTNRMEDFEEITKAAYKAHPKRTRNRIAFLLIGTAVLFLPFLGVGGVRRPDWSLWPLLPFAVCLIYSGFQSPKRIARKQYGNSIRPYEYKAEISENGIITLSPTVRTELKWAAFSHSIEGMNVIALIYEAVMYVFPRRAFSEEQWREFIRLIRQHVPLNS